MITLKGNNVYLRPLEPTDLNFAYEMENDESVWEASHTNTPFSRFVIKKYLENADQDIYTTKQLRLVICSTETKKSLGFIDIFEFDPYSHRAGIGIIIKDSGNRNKGIGSDALELVIKYSFHHLNLHQLYVNISTDNEASLSLFTKYGFVLIGTKKDWNLVNGKWKDESMFQLIK